MDVCKKTDLLVKTKAILRSLLVSNPDGIMNIDKLCFDYLKYEGKARIPYEELGYETLKTFLLSMPDILKIDSRSGAIEPVTSNSESRHIHLLVSSQRSARRNRGRNGRSRGRNRGRNRQSTRNSRGGNGRSTVNNRRDNNNRRQSQQSHPSDKINRPHNLVDDELSKRLSQMELKPANNGGTVIVENPEVPKAIQMPGSLELATGRKIPNKNLCEFKAEQTYEIFVTEINRPWRFWFCLWDIDAMQIIEDQLKWYYEDETLTMKESEMIVGNACVAFYKNKWLRAEFLDKPIDKTIRVCFVDYGTIDVVQISKCRQISEYFSSIPKFCFPGVLDFMKKIENPDKELSLVRRFCEMVRNKPLIGYVNEVDYNNNVVRMVLIDTSKEDEDIIINKELIV